MVNQRESCFLCSIPLAVKSGNTVMRMNKHVYARERDDMRKLLRMQQPWRSPHGFRIRRVHFHSIRRNQIRDAENLMFGHKPLLDCLVLEGLLQDDRSIDPPLWCLPTYTQEPARGTRKRTLIAVWDASPAECLQIVTDEQRVILDKHGQLQSVPRSPVDADGAGLPVRIGGHALPRLVAGVHISGRGIDPKRYDDDSDRASRSHDSG